MRCEGGILVPKATYEHTAEQSEAWRFESC